LPRKRGFNNIFRTEYNIVNVGELNSFSSGSEVNMEELLKTGSIKSLARPTKILGGGDVHHSLVVKASKFSAAAERKIVAAGGKVERV